MNRPRPRPTSVPGGPVRIVETPPPGSVWPPLIGFGLLVAAAVGICWLGVYLDGPPRRCLEPRTRTEWWEIRGELKPHQVTTCDRWDDQQGASR